MSEEMYRIEFEIDDEKVESEGVYVLDSIYTAVREECEENGMQKCGENCYEIAAEGNYSKTWHVLMNIRTPEIRRYLKKLTWRSDPEDITEDVLNMKVIQGDKFRKKITFKVNVDGLKKYFFGTHKMRLKQAVDEYAAIVKDHGFERSVWLGGFVSAFPVTHTKMNAVITPDIVKRCEWIRDDCLSEYWVASVSETTSCLDIIRKAVRGG